MCSIDSCLNVPSTSWKEALIDTIGFNSVKSLQTGPGCFVLVIVHRFEHSFNVNTERSSCKECEEILTQLYSMQCVMQPWCNRETTRGLHHRHNLESWILKHGRAIATSAKLKLQWQSSVLKISESKANATLLSLEVIRSLNVDTSIFQPSLQGKLWKLGFYDSFMVRPIHCRSKAILCLVFCQRQSLVRKTKVWHTLA